MSNFPRTNGDTRPRAPEPIPWHAHPARTLLLHAIFGQRDALHELGRRFAERNDREARQAIEDYHAAIKDMQAATC